MDCEFEALQDAYAIIWSGQRLSMAQWTPARDVLRALANSAVRIAAGRYKVPQRTWRELIDNVEGELTVKVCRRGLGDPATIKNFEAMLRMVARHATITVLRSIKSPMTGRLISDPDHTAPEEASGSDDIFLEVRTRMEPFRFPEHRLARDALLAFRLATSSFPGPGFLRSMVPSHTRTVCYNAAVVDINMTILSIRGIEDDVRATPAAA